MSLGLRYKDDSHIFDERGLDGTPYLQFSLLESTGIVDHGFSTKLGGVSRGEFASLNLSFERGDDPDAVRERDYTDVDGLITDVPGICLVTSFADCVPLYFVDPVKKAIGLSHSGWRGTVGKIGKKTVEMMSEHFGSDPGDILAAVGPSVCVDCYEVSEDVIEKFRENFEEKYWEELFYRKENGKYQLDLWKANELIFREAGILPEHMAVTNVCTHCNSEILYSHRTAGNRRGNLCAFLALRQGGK